MATDTPPPPDTAEEAAHRDPPIIRWILIGVAVWFLKGAIVGTLVNSPYVGLAAIAVLAFLLATTRFGQHLSPFHGLRRWEMLLFCSLGLLFAWALFAGFVLDKKPLGTWPTILVILAAAWYEFRQERLRLMTVITIAVLWLAGAAAFMALLYFFHFGGPWVVGAISQRDVLTTLLLIGLVALLVYRGLRRRLRDTWRRDLQDAWDHDRRVIQLAAVYLIGGVLVHASVYYATGKVTHRNLDGTFYSNDPGQMAITMLWQLLAIFVIFRYYWRRAHEDRRDRTEEAEATRVRRAGAETATRGEVLKERLKRDYRDVLIRRLRMTEMTRVEPGGEIVLTFREDYLRSLPFNPSVTLAELDALGITYASIQAEVEAEDNQPPNGDDGDGDPPTPPTTDGPGDDEEEEPPLAA